MPPAVVRILRGLSLVAAGGVTWWQTQSWWKTALASAGGYLLTFAGKIWAVWEPDLVKAVAEWANPLKAWEARRYARRYTKHLYYRHRTFDVKGFSTQGQFALELENVYVDLDVDAATVREVPQDPIRLPKDLERFGRRGIQEWLLRPGNFAIVGPPGSGKTTLLKHLALSTAALKATPILLFLREHAAAIAANPDVKLAELAEASLKNLPPPAGWFAGQLARGKCVVMLDGLDEVADAAVRKKTVRWVEKQVETLGANRFLVSSRPNGYRDNPLSGFTVLSVLPFNRTQVERFVHNWYLANEAMAHQKDDPGVRMEAERGAADLLARLESTSTLAELAVNPLLLTLIATVHRYRSKLPGRRVELFAEICDVFLGNLHQARGIEMDLTPAQKIHVLRVLAYELMVREKREIAAADAERAIGTTLALVEPGGDAGKFLRMVEDSSGLLVERESGVYGFAHLTFQEYLAALHVKEEGLVAELAGRVGWLTWWDETARLFAAQADASPIVEACLEEPLSVDALVLATDCEAEALQLRAEVRERLRSITDESIEDRTRPFQRVAAFIMLTRRLRSIAAPADSGPTRRMPALSKRASEPPPAPTV